MPYCEIVSHPQVSNPSQGQVYIKDYSLPPQANQRAMNSFSTRTFLNRLTPAPLSLAQKRTVVGLPRHSGVVFRCSSQSPKSTAVRPIAGASALTGLVRGLGRVSRRYKSTMASNGTHELRFSKKSLKDPPSLITMTATNRTLIKGNPAVL